METEAENSDWREGCEDDFGCLCHRIREVKPDPGAEGEERKEFPLIKEKVFLVKKMIMRYNCRYKCTLVMPSTCMLSLQKRKKEYIKWKDQR